MVTPSPGRGDYYNDLNDEFLEKEAVIELNDGSEMQANQIRVEADSVSWNESITGNRCKVSAINVKRISRRNHVVGGLEGVGIGTLVDGAMLAVISSTRQHEFPLSGFFILVGIPPLVGVFGAVSGHRYEYSFPMDSTHARH